jgi:hypothetical protein
MFSQADRCGAGAEPNPATVSSSGIFCYILHAQWWLVDARPTL